MLRHQAIRLLTHKIRPLQRLFSAEANRNDYVNRFRLYTPDQGFYWKSPYESVHLPDLMLDEYVWKNVQKWENKIAIECGVTGRKYSYAKLRDACAALAIRLQQNFKLTHGDVVAICLPNVPEFAVALLGSIEAGLIVTTINPKYTVEEASKQLKMSNTKLIFGLAEESKKLFAIREAVKDSIHIVAVKTSLNQTIPDGIADLAQLIDKKDIHFTLLDYKTRNVEDICLLPYSSGTTGLPKGVMLTQLNETSNCEIMNAKIPYESFIQPTTNSFQDVLLCILPFFHIYGLTVNLLSKLSLGCKLVTLPKFEVNDYLNNIIKHQASILYLVPYLMLLWSKSDQATTIHSKSVRSIMSAAAPIGPSDYERFKEKCPTVELLQGYGLTETSPLASITPKGCQNYATIGFPLPNTEFKIVKVDDSKFIGVESEQIGELLIRGPLIMKGYLSNESATKEAILPDGWFRTGDLCSYDDDGYFYVKDRLKELIKVRSFQVAPAEIEEILRQHPKVLDAAVIGVPDPICGEVPKAFIVKRKHIEVTENELKSYIAQHLVSYKHLEGGVQFIDSIPKTDSGKYLRKDLKKL